MISKLCAAMFGKGAYTDDPKIYKIVQIFKASSPITIDMFITHCWQSSWEKYLCLVTSTLKKINSDC